MDNNWVNFGEAIYVDLDQVASFVMYPDRVAMIFRNGFTYDLLGKDAVWRKNLKKFLDENCKRMD